MCSKQLIITQSVHILKLSKLSCWFHSPLKPSPAASLTAEASLLIVICQAEDIVLCHDDHGGLVLARPGAGGGCKFVCHEHAVHNALLLGDEVVAGAGSQTSVRHHVRSCYFDLPAQIEVLQSVTISRCSLAQRFTNISTKDLPVSRAILYLQQCPTHNSAHQR